MLQFRDPNRIPSQEVFNPGSSVENVDGIGEKCGQAANELRREIGVKKKFQRKRRSRPACEA
jgi:hypothetical protein